MSESLNWSGCSPGLLSSDAHAFASLSVHTFLSIEDRNNQDVYRPIQYLGSKLRALEELKTHISEIISPKSHVLDLFSGSTVVSQSFARLGMRVTATDAMAYSATFGKSLLNVGKSKDVGTANQLAQIIFSNASTDKLLQIFSPWLRKENAALKDLNADALFALAVEIPQIWRQKSASSDLKRLFAALKNAEGQSGIDIGGLIATHYAGTYFSLSQAITLDILRVAVERSYISKQITEWHYQTALTGLLSAMSIAAYTPGKHFAQYHKISKTKDLTFHRSRIVSDRRVDICLEFEKALQQIFVISENFGSGHASQQITMEEILIEPQQFEDVDLIYADPPYTAQQYSRFYHVPEVFLKYSIPTLQVFRGKHTSGLYPEHKFKSRFSSKAHAKAAFMDLLTLSSRLGAHLVISYSNTESGKTGNARMISLDDLRSLCGAYSTNIEVIALSHKYRQFNSAAASVAGRVDPEYIISLKPSC